MRAMAQEPYSRSIRSCVPVAKENPIMTTLDAQATTAPEVVADPVEELAGRLFMEGLGALHLGTVYLGVKLGLFEELAAHDTMTSSELAAARGLDEWYVREWLQAEATAGLVLADDDDLTRARFRLAPGVPDVLVEQTSAAYLGGMALAAASAYSVMPQLLSAFGTGAGVAYSDYGEDAVEAQAALNRPAFIHSLASEWIPAIPDVAARFADTTTPARVADVGCGLGWSSIELARAFPHVIVDGYDADESSIARARRNAEDAGVADRVSFHLVDASSGYGSGDYDLVVFFECVHDMAHPDAVLAAARDAVSADGAVIVMDERTADRLTPGDPVETFFATISVLWCLPQGRVDADSQTVGTVMRTDRFRAIARDAGWSDADVLDIEHPFFRFYRLVR